MDQTGKGVWSVEELYEAIDTEELMKNVGMTSELFWSGVITKDNAINNLWRKFHQARDDSNKVRIASSIEHIERGYW